MHICYCYKFVICYSLYNVFDSEIDLLLFIGGASRNGSASPSITKSPWLFSSLQGYGYALSTCLFDDEF